MAGMRRAGWRTPLCWRREQSHAKQNARQGEKGSIITTAAWALPSWASCSFCRKITPGGKESGAHFFFCLEFTQTCSKTVAFAVASGGKRLVFCEEREIKYSCAFERKCIRSVFALFFFLDVRKTRMPTGITIATKLRVWPSQEVGTPTLILGVATFVFLFALRAVMLTNLVRARDVNIFQTLTLQAFWQG